MQGTLAVFSVRSTMGVRVAFRVIVLTAIAVSSALLLGACADSQDSGSELEMPESAHDPAANDNASGTTLPAPSPAEEVRAFHFESGDLILGPFEPEDVLANPFNPCSDISEAEFAEAGLEKRKAINEETSHLTGIFYCSMVSEDPNFTEAISINAADKEILISQAKPIEQFSSTLIPDAIALPGQDGQDDTCYFGVETNRGFFTAVVGSLGIMKGREQTCPRAIRILEEFYNRSSNAV